MSHTPPLCSVWDTPPRFPLPPSTGASRRQRAAVVGAAAAAAAAADADAVATCSAFPALLQLACRGNTSAAAGAAASSSSDALCLQTARDLANIRPWGANDASASAAAAAAAATSTADPPPTSCLDALASPGSVCLVLALAACVGGARSRVCCARRQRYQNSHHRRGDVSPRSLREGAGEGGGGGGGGGDGDEGDGIEDPEGVPPSAQEVRLEDVVTVLWAFVELAGVVSTLLCRAVYGRARGGRERVVFSYRVHYSSSSGDGDGDGDGAGDGDDESGALLEELFINDLGAEVGGLVWADRTALFESAREEHRRRQTLCAQYASYFESLASPPPLAPVSLLPPKAAVLDNEEVAEGEAEEEAVAAARGPHEGDELCCICLDVLGSAQTLTLTSCVHSHHLGCLTDYVVHQVKRGVGKPCCPTCRTAIKLPWSCDDGGGGSGSAEEDAYLNDVSMRADLDELDAHTDLAAQLDNEWSYNMFVGGGSQLFC